MRNLFAVIICSFLISATGFKKQVEFKDETFTGKLVIKGPCGQRVVSVISPIPGNIKIQEKWEDPVSGELYKHVFSVRNFCELSSLEEGETFTFKFIKMKMNVCTTCLLYRPIPDADGAIVIVQKKVTDSFKYIKD